jgi:hypothetical protein
MLIFGCEEPECHDRTGSPRNPEEVLEEVPFSAAFIENDEDNPSDEEF